MLEKFKDVSPDVIDFVRYYLAACVALLIGTTSIEVAKISPWWIDVPVAFIVALAGTSSGVLFALAFANLLLVWKGLKK